jgi:hypothetical protein
MCYTICIVYVAMMGALPAGAADRAKRGVLGL